MKQPITPAAASGLLLSLLLLAGCHDVSLKPALIPGPATAREVPTGAGLVISEDPPLQLAAWQQADSLVLLVRSSSPLLFRALRRGGVTLWLDETGRARRRTGLLLSGNALAGEEMPNRTTPPQRRAAPDRGSDRWPVFMDHFLAAETLLLKDGPKGELRMAGKSSPLSHGLRLFSRDRVLHLRLVLPLQGPLDRKSGLSFEGSQQVSFRLESEDLDPSRSGRPGGMLETRGGRGGGRGGGQGPPRDPNGGGPQGVSRDLSFDLKVKLVLPAEES